ncbi:MAG: hypothetical protein AAF696_25830 [Bacteroidota bacterium]
MDPRKEKWINEVMGSLDGKEAAAPNPFLFAKIKRKVSEQDASQPQLIRGKLLLLAFAALALLICLNFLALSEIRESKSRLAGQVGNDNSSYSLVFEDGLNIYEDEAGFTL